MIYLKPVKGMMIQHNNGKTGVIVDDGGITSGNFNPDRYKDWYVRIDWNDGSSLEDVQLQNLELLEDVNIPPLSPAEEEDYPIGQRVCLNPESVLCEGYKTEIQCQSGFIVALSTISRSKVLVYFDNQKQYKIQKTALLKVDAPPANIVQYKLDSGSLYYEINGNPDNALHYALFIYHYKCIDTKIIK